MPGMYLFKQFQIIINQSTSTNAKILYRPSQYFLQWSIIMQMCADAVIQQLTLLNSCSMTALWYRFFVNKYSDKALQFEASLYKLVILNRNKPFPYQTCCCNAIALLYMFILDDRVPTCHSNNLNKFKKEATITLQTMLVFHIVV